MVGHPYILSLGISHLALCKLEIRNLVPVDVYCYRYMMFTEFEHIKLTSFSKMRVDLAAQVYTHDSTQLSQYRC